MAAAGAAGPALFKEQPAPDNEDSNVSSPLSDVEDADPDDASLDGLGLDRQSPVDGTADDDEEDSDSNLSEANDTEAETERLYDTPQAQRQKDVVIGPFTDGPIFEQTPSKLNKTFSVDEDEADDGDNDSLSDNDDVSMTSSRPGDDEEEEEEEDAEASPTKITKSTEQSSVDDTQDSVESKKRKRSPAAEQSDADQPLRKRTGSVAAKDVASGQNTPTVGGGDDDDDPLSTHPNSGIQSGAEDVPPPPVLIPKPSRETASASVSPVKQVHTHKMTRSGSKRRSDDDEETGDADAEVDNDTHEEATADEEADQLVDEEHNEDDADAATRNDEELERKQAALEEWNDLEAKFSLFRDRLYKDRLEKLEAEEQSLQSENPTHAEYLMMKACVDERLEKKLAQINTEHELTIQAMDRLAVARRAQIWGQFYQGIREKREQFLEKLNHDWYDTQNARRSAHSVPDYGVQFPANPAQRTRNAVAYNTEVSYLAGLAKHEGFPAVPEMRGASAAEMEEDFEAFKRATRPPPPPPSVAPPREEFHPTSYALGPAGEQFIKNTPWANPNHVSHKMQSVPLQSESGPSAAMPAALPPTKPTARKNGHPPPPPPPKHSPTMADASPETLRTATMLSQGVSRKRNGSLGVGVGRGPKAPSQEAPKPDAAAVAVS